MLILPENCRGLLKEPFGRLFSDFSLLAAELSGKKLCTAGDVVTARAVSCGILPDIAVIDGVTRRDEAVTPVFSGGVQLSAQNPAGTITDELIAALKEAYEKQPALVTVEGEEDLAVLPLIEILPGGWAVVYGQPGEGAVLCIVDAELKKFAREILSKFVRV
ncbi:MAG TPA: DUF359 domain-containing protein [Methanocorpusculum sp.]|nr:DUF359 domain-containing protein [Candidatus Methanocorpusculum equi]MCQ2357160.1 DUF359 domain-containing protein [Methanocorpusculum sp.]HJJ33816.1 DUF359 domain-containing protein [Methanocorpusculum sp.]HJJ44960.1 DUF359 domain-containing protein [Methanocorpusculum sp.]HJJ58960.1 DUF359 domain-containing protein [Methanocorpusculum sp.]